MYERLLNKAVVPNEKSINELLGLEAVELLNQFNEILLERYKADKELKFPFGNNYGWGYKYFVKTKHICYAFFENKAFTVTFQISGKAAEKHSDCLEQLSNQAKELWNNRYPCGEGGGWVHFRILSDKDISDVMLFLKMRLNK